MLVTSFPAVRRLHVRYIGGGVNGLRSPPAADAAVGAGPLPCASGDIDAALQRLGPAPQLEALLLEVQEEADDEEEDGLQGQQHEGGKAEDRAEQEGHPQASIPQPPPAPAAAMPATGPVLGAEAMRRLAEAYPSLQQLVVSCNSSRGAVPAGRPVPDTFETLLTASTTVAARAAEDEEAAGPAGQPGKPSPAGGGGGGGAAEGGPRAQLPPAPSLDALQLLPGLTSVGLAGVSLGRQHMEQLAALPGLKVGQPTPSGWKGRPGGGGGDGEGQAAGGREATAERRLHHLAHAKRALAPAPLKRPACLRPHPTHAHAPALRMRQTPCTNQSTVPNRSLHHGRL